MLGFFLFLFLLGDGFVYKENYFYSILKLLQGSLCAARRAAAFVRGDDVIHKLFTELAYRYK